MNIRVIDQLEWSTAKGGHVKYKTFLFGGAALLVLAGGLFLYLLAVGKGQGDALATVNGEKITADQFAKAVEKVQEPARTMFKEDPAQFLDIMIIKSLVLQELKAQNFTSEKGTKDEDELIEEFLEKKFADPPAVSEEEVKAFYETHKERMEGKTLEQIAPMIQQVLGQGKLEEEYARYLAGIREKADVKINQEGLQSVSTKPPDFNTKEEFSAALKNGKPLLVDFGSNSCIPCRQLRPILQEISREKAGRMDVLVIDVYRYKDLAQEYKIQVIPTIIIFDAAGKEVFRGQGFMPKEAIMDQLKKVEIG
ncbi:MAG: hypothetical protein C4582_12280 [Desulfobacteraceae bacterium]|nr:MAG: hypothetical protein C4582_12280 [Desulfobacteraceae bacterium]